MSRMYDEMISGGKRKGTTHSGWYAEVTVLNKAVIDEAVKRIAILPVAVDRNTALLASMESAAKIIQDAGRANLSARLNRSTGTLLNQFSVRRRTRQMTVVAGFRRPLGAHAHIVDLGTGRRYTSKGEYRGIMPANRFWTDAKEITSGRVQEVFLAAVDRAITRILTK